MIFQLIILSTWFIYIFLEAKVQGYLFKKDEGYKPNYLVLFIFRGIFSIIHGGPIMEATNEISYSLLVIFQACSFWIFFDLLLNKLRGKPWNYRGSQSGWLDRIGNDWLYWTLKVLAFIGMFISGYLVIKLTA